VRSLKLGVILIGLLTLVVGGGPVAGSTQLPDSVLQQADAPPNGVWIESLDLTGVAIRPLGRGGRGAGGQPPATPVPAPSYMLGGSAYPHTVALVSDRDMLIDLKGRAVRFDSMVGIDTSVPAGGAA
jgi:hypothetical protein